MDRKISKCLDDGKRNFQSAERNLSKLELIIAEKNIKSYFDNLNALIQLESEVTAASENKYKNALSELLSLDGDFMRMKIEETQKDAQEKADVFKKIKRKIQNLKKLRFCQDDENDEELNKEVANQAKVLLDEIYEIADGEDDLVNLEKQAEELYTEIRNMVTEQKRVGKIGMLSSTWNSAGTSGSCAADGMKTPSDENLENGPASGAGNYQVRNTNMAVDLGHDQHVTTGEPQTSDWSRRQESPRRNAAPVRDEPRRNHGVAFNKWSLDFFPALSRDPMLFLNWCETVRKIVSQFKIDDFTSSIIWSNERIIPQQSLREALLGCCSLEGGIKIISRLLSSPGEIAAKLESYWSNTPKPSNEELLVFVEKVRSTLKRMNDANLPLTISRTRVLQLAIRKLPARVREESAAELEAGSSLEDVLHVMEHWSKKFLIINRYEDPRVQPQGMKNKGKRFTGIVQENVDQQKPQGKRSKMRCDFQDCKRPETHFTRSCRKWKSMDIDERWARIRDEGRCSTCMAKHKQEECPVSHWKCKVEGCGEKHYTLLHKETL